MYTCTGGALGVERLDGVVLLLGGTHTNIHNHNA